MKKLLLVTTLLLASTSVYADFYKGYSKDDVRCLATNIYFESRNQSKSGKVAVGLVTVNRTNAPNWPNTICGVVTQAKLWEGNPIRNKCQFSWYCDGLSDSIRDIAAWEDAVLRSYDAIDLDEISADFTDGATHYHTVHVSPWWQDKYEFIVRIDDHKFYK